MQRRYFIHTFGCQMNEHDSARMGESLARAGWARTDAADSADLVLLNTCAIREKAEEKLYSALGRYRMVKARRGARIGVAGCVAQQEKDKLLDRAPYVDFVLGPDQIARVSELAEKGGIETGWVPSEEYVFPQADPESARGTATTFVTVMKGCDNVCSFCVVPHTRGREVSRPSHELIAEVERLAADGVREVTLLGQNVNSYGRDLPSNERVSFAQLLELVDAVDGIERIRYTSPHPKDMREDVIRAHAELPALCEHIHLPLQSGSSRVLKRMRRTYTRERYLDRVAMIREHVPDCALTTDIIVGFPGETDEDFLATLDVAEQVGYDGAFTFNYSPRRGTEAATLPNQVPHEVKIERMERLVEVVQRRARERAQRFVGRTLEVLVEGPSRTDPAKLRGRSRHNKVVNFTGLGAPGELVQVQIDGATSQTLTGSHRIASYAA